MEYSVSNAVNKAKNKNNDRAKGYMISIVIQKQILQFESWADSAQLALNPQIWLYLQEDAFVIKATKSLQK